MTEIKQRLFDAFKADHALLGSGFYALATCLRDKDIAGAKQAATRIDNEAGLHMAFEEDNFYPALKRFLEQNEIDSMYAETERGAELLEKILALNDSVVLSDALQQELLAEVFGFETHVSECGELFGVMGGLSNAEMQKLLEKLNDYHIQAHTWLSRPRRSQATAVTES